MKETKEEKRERERRVADERERKEIRRRIPKPSVAPLSLLRANWAEPRLAVGRTGSEEASIDSPPLLSAPAGFLSLQNVRRRPTPPLSPSVSRFFASPFGIPSIRGPRERVPSSLPARMLASCRALSTRMKEFATRSSESRSTGQRDGGIEISKRDAAFVSVAESWKRYRETPSYKRVYVKRSRNAQRKGIE